VKDTFPSHLAILKAKFCYPKLKSIDGTLVVSLLDPTLLNQRVVFLV